MVLTLLATAFNVWLLPRLGGRWLWRRREAVAGWAAGIVLYPLTVFLLLAVFYRRPEVAGAGWGLLAFGDGVATLAGERWGKARLAWNREKTWVGSLAYFFVGGAAVFLLVSWIVPGRYEFPFLALVSAAVALLATLLESAPQKLDDNLGVPLVASLFLLCALDTAGGWQSLGDPSFRHRLLWGLACNVVLVALAYSMGTLTRSGALVACLIGTLVVAFLCKA